MPRIERFFDVKTTIVAEGQATGRFGIGLLLTTAADVSAGGPRKASRADTMAAFRRLTADTNARAKAEAWFSSEVAPEALYLGRWAPTDISTQLTGARVTAAAGEGAFNSASAGFSYDGNDYTADLSGASSYDAIATAIQIDQTLSLIHTPSPRDS